MKIREYKGYHIVPTEIRKNKQRFCSIILRPKSNINKIIKFHDKPFSNIGVAIQATKYYINNHLINKSNNKNMETTTSTISNEIKNAVVNKKTIAKSPKKTSAKVEKKNPVGRPRIHPFVAKKYKLTTTLGKAYSGLPDKEMTEIQIKDYCNKNLKFNKAVTSNIFDGLVFRKYLVKNNKNRYVKGDGMKKTNKN